MLTENELTASNRRIGAISELKARIHQKFPNAEFTESEGDDPAGTYLWTIVDLDDPDEVMDLVVGRVIEMQVDEGIPVYVIPMRPFSRPGDLLEGAIPNLSNEDNSASSANDA